VPSFSGGENKHRTVNKRCTAIRRGQLIDKTFGIAVVAVLGGAVPSGIPVAVRAYYGLQAVIFSSKQTDRESIDN
jgi:hypothetical protein